MDIRELISEPFGPYMDEQFLTDACKTTPSRILSLKGLMLECRGKPTGLTELEPLNIESRPTDPVRFRGVLEIGNLSWITAEGQKQLQDSIRRKWGKKNKGTAPCPSLSLIYKSPIARGDKVRVWIQGYKNMSAGYLTSDLVPMGLMLTTRDRNRHYEVLSMDIETYTRSELYLDRYRLLNTMTHIASQDPSVPPVKRDITFFVKGYFQHCAYPEHAKTQRLLCKARDKDLIDPAQGLLRRPRLLRQVHRAEVYAAFAEHAEWIRDEQRARQKQRRIIDLDVWNAFIKDAKLQRVKASRHGVQWGVPAGYYASDAEEDQEDEEEEVEMEVNPPRQHSSSPEIQPEPSGRTKRSAPSALPLVRPNSRPRLSKPRPNHGDIYDSDFSQPSSPSSSASASSLSSPDPDILDSYPPWGLERARIGADLIWTCPQGCGFQLNMVEEGRMRGLFNTSRPSPNYARGELDIGKLQALLEMLVHRHWMIHLDEKGLEYVETPKGYIIRRQAGYRSW